MPYLQSNIPHFKAWVRREYTVNHERYHGEFLHAMVIAVTTMPTRCLSFQVIFTGCEADEEEGETNVHGGAMWARMPITALVADTPFEEWPEPMAVHDAQPWDCSSHTHAVYVLDRCTPCPWLAKIDGEFYPAKYYFTVDVSKDWNNYNKYGYVQGSSNTDDYDKNIDEDKKHHLIKNATPKIIPLTERNMPDNEKGSPNTWFYPEAKPPIKAIVIINLI